MTRRKKPAAGTLPAPLVAWFRGERTRPPWRDALAFPGWPLLPERWATWAESNPGAMPPDGWQWLADSGHARHKVSLVALASARRAAGDAYRIR